MEEFQRALPKVRLVDSLGTRGYFSLMSRAAVMVGNSSSGVIEAASFRLPVVNVGLRQAGRERSGNVIDVGNTQGEIAEGIRLALTPEFRAKVQGVKNVYGDGRAAQTIIPKLKATPIDERLLIKRFHDL